MAVPRIALAVTVRDEARLLRANLEYHRHLGVERAFVYLDEDVDCTRRSVADLSFVELAPCVPARRFAGQPGLETFVDAWETHLAARQCLNVVDAMERAAVAGCEWLLSIDADELVCLDRDSVREGGLAERLARVAARAEVVHFPNLEVVQGVNGTGLVFAEATYFKRHAAALARPILDPRSGASVSRPWFFGHSAGKSAARLRPSVRPASSHAFVTLTGEPLRQQVVGELLHYYAYDFGDWLKRCRAYRGHADLHLTGLAVEPHKLLWIELVNETDLSHGELRRYYDETLAFEPPRLAELAAWNWKRPFERPPLVEVPAVVRFFAGSPRTLPDRTPVPSA